MSSVSPGAFSTTSREVLADAVVRHAARDLDAGLRHVGELDRVVRVRPHRVGEVLADLALDDVERRRELDVADVVAAEVDVHEAGDELVVVGVLVVLAALEQRVGAVADADDRDADLAVVQARAPVRAAVSRHGCSSINELLADVQDALRNRDPRRRGQEVDRPLEPAPRREHEPGGDHDDALGAGAEADVAAQAERLRLRADVRDEEGAGDGRRS